MSDKPRTQPIKASVAEIQTFSRRIAETNQADEMARRAREVTTDLFTMFCEGHGIPGATFVAIEGDSVLVVPRSDDGDA